MYQIVGRAINTMTEKKKKEKKKEGGNKKGMAGKEKKNKRREMQFIPREPHPRKLLFFFINIKIAFSHYKGEEKNNNT